MNNISQGEELSVTVFSCVSSVCIKQCSETSPLPTDIRRKRHEQRTQWDAKENPPEDHQHLRPQRALGRALPWVVGGKAGGLPPPLSSRRRQTPDNFPNSPALSAPFPAANAGVARCSPPSHRPPPALPAAGLTWGCGEDEGQKAAAADEPGGAQPHGRGPSALLRAAPRGARRRTAAAGKAAPPARSAAGYRRGGAGGGRDGREGGREGLPASSRSPCPPPPAAKQSLPTPGSSAPALLRGGGERSRAPCAPRAPRLVRPRARGGNLGGRGRREVWWWGVC